MMFQERLEVTNFQIITITNISRIIKTVAIINLITVQYLKWTAHVCRKENVRLAKNVKFALLTRRFFTGTPVRDYDRTGKEGRAAQT